MVKMPSQLIKQRIMKKRREFASYLLRWASKNLDDFPWRKSKDPYRILISEMLLRRTRAPKVAEIYEEFIRTFPTVDTLAKGKIKEIRRIIEPLGMVSRSKKMKEVAQLLIKNYHGGFPSEESVMLSTIGSQSLYAANAIRCFALGEPAPIFDSNVKRILERVFSLDLGSDAHKKKQSWEIAGLLVPKTGCKNYNLALLDVGRKICTPRKPKCAKCPLNSLCDFANEVQSQRMFAAGSLL